MANVIRVATLGPNCPSETPAPDQRAVDKMKEFWRFQLDQVLVDKPDLIVIPETSDRFIKMSLENQMVYYQVRGNQMRDFFCEIAAKHKCNIAYSAIRLLDKGHKANSTQIINRSGKVIGIYDKNCTVIQETEIKGVQFGTQTPIIECDFGKIACAICFDLNFVEVLEKYGTEPDVIIFCSMYHGGLMQNYWAFQAQAHFIGAVYENQCTIIDPIGELLGKSTDYYNFISMDINLDCKVVHLDGNVQKIQNAKKKYGKSLTLKDPGHLGAVLLTCESKDLSIQDIINDFEIELLSEYFKRSRYMYSQSHKHL